MHFEMGYLATLALGMIISLQHASAWQRWRYDHANKAPPYPYNQASNNEFGSDYKFNRPHEYYRDIEPPNPEWKNRPQSPPGQRQGHSMNMWGSKIVIFGGRSNDQFQYHLPRTYKVGEKLGFFGVLSYFDTPVYQLCNSTPGAEGRTGICQNVGNVQLGKYFNDVWFYDLECHRTFDTPCQNVGWVNMHPGNDYGGCEP